MQLVSLRSGCRLAVASAFAVFRLCADTVSLLPVADATLFENVPTNSLGGAEWITAGTTQNYTRNRALLKFDIAGAVPAGSRILAMTLSVNVTGTPRDGNAQSSFSLRRMFKSWGEGINVPANAQYPGFGSLAAPGDATWLARFAQTTNTWTEPGGTEGVDFSETLSALVFIESHGYYIFESLLAANEDVQFWLENPALNFGWMIKCESEELNFTGRRFGSREYNDPYVSPRLDLYFQAPPRFSTLERTNNSVALSLQVEAGFSYTVQYRDSIPATNAWLTLTNIGAATQTMDLTVFDSLAGTQRFYRIRRD